jgi:hypothetical protein
MRTIEDIVQEACALDTSEGVLATHREEGMINLTSSIKALYGNSLIDTKTFAENSGPA